MFNNCCGHIRGSAIFHPRKVDTQALLLRDGWGKVVELYNTTYAGHPFVQPQLDPRVFNSDIDLNLVWQRVWRRNHDFIESAGPRLYKGYSDGLAQLELDSEEFPTLDRINTALSKVGWRAIWVSGFLPSRVFADFVMNRCFPLAVSVRSLDDAEHSPVPDAIHDIYGHLPLLFDHEYSEFLVEISSAIVNSPIDSDETNVFEAQNRLGLLEASDASAAEIAEAQNQLADVMSWVGRGNGLSTRLSRLFLWTIEFGLLSSKSGQGTNGPVILGAAILSSPAETSLVLEQKIKVMPLTLKAAGFDINFTRPQDQLFVADSLAQIRNIFIEALQYNDRMGPMTSVTQVSTSNGTSFATALDPSRVRSTEDSGYIPGSLCSYEEASNWYSKYPEYEAGIRWIREFIAKPNEKMPRPGAVCPFAAPAMQSNLLKLLAVDANFDIQKSDSDGGASHGLGVADQRMNFVENCAREAAARCLFLADLFYREFPDPADQSAASLLVFFPQLKSEYEAAFIDKGHQLMRMEFVRRGLMLGEFHKHSNVESVRAEGFKVMRSPVPMFAVRALSKHDIMFLDRPLYAKEERLHYLHYYLQHLDSALSATAKNDVRKRIEALNA